MDDSRIRDVLGCPALSSSGLRQAGLPRLTKRHHFPKVTFGPMFLRQDAAPVIVTAGQFSS